MDKINPTNMLQNNVKILTKKSCKMKDGNVWTEEYISEMVGDFYYNA